MFAKYLIACTGRVHLQSERSLKFERSFTSKGERMKSTTFVLLKPHLSEKECDEILSFYGESGLETPEVIEPNVAYKVQCLDTKLVRELYSHIEGEPFFSEILEHMTSGPCRIAFLSSFGFLEELIDKVRKLNGDTDPCLAEQGTVRNTYGESRTKNAVHTPDSVENLFEEAKILGINGTIK